MLIEEILCSPVEVYLITYIIPACFTCLMFESTLDAFLSGYAETTTRFTLTSVLFSVT